MLPARLRGDETSELQSVLIGRHAPAAGALCNLVGGVVSDSGCDVHEAVRGLGEGGRLGNPGSGGGRACRCCGGGGGGLFDFAGGAVEAPSPVAIISVCTVAAGGDEGAASGEAGGAPEAGRSDVSICDSLSATSAPAEGGGESAGLLTLSLPRSLLSNSSLKDGGAGGAGGDASDAAGVVHSGLVS